MHSEESIEPEATMSTRQISMNGSSIDTSNIERKLDEGNVEEAESALCEALSLNSQVSHFKFRYSLQLAPPLSFPECTCS